MIRILRGAMQMTAPVLTTELAYRLEQTELHVLQSRLTVLAEQPGNPMGVSIKSLGNGAALQIKGIPGPTYNTVLGLGPKEIDRLDEIVEFYDQAKIPCQIEVTPAYTSPAFLKELSVRDFYPHHFQSTLYGVPLKAPPLLPEGVTIRSLTEDEFDLYGDMYVQGFGMPWALRGEIATSNQILHNRPGWHFYLACVDDQPAAIAVLFIQDGVAVLNGAATLPEMRGRGCQSALLKHRMHVAREHGCQWITASSRYATTSMQNMQRAGLQLAYTKVCWMRPALQTAYS
jgi:GNAT superfamily N-acetyltransferase